jgi:uncharacterized protein (DUF2252 family)
VKRGNLGHWRPPKDRPDPIDLIEEAHAGRLEHLIPVRVGRMAVSPYAFLRGAASLMAEDFARMARTGIEPVICGDAHLGNFGFYASPERNLVFDLNDFDEAHPGPWEWDLWRLATSIWVAGRQNSLPEGTCEDAVLWCAAAYRRQIGRLAGQPLLGRSFDRMDIDRMRQEMADWSLRAEIERAANLARLRTSDRALPKLTREREGVRQIVDQPPVVMHVSDEEKERLIDGLEAYLKTLPPHWRRVLSWYVVVDVAHKVVGVGSVGLRAFVVLLQGNGAHDMLFLQLKQARRSCVASFVHGETAWHAHFTREHHGWLPRPSAGALPRQQGCRLTKNQRIVMSLAIRALPMAVRGVCALCKTEQDLSSWDSNLGGRICRDCEPFLEMPKPRWWPLSMATPALRLSCVTLGDRERFNGHVWNSLRTLEA